MGFTGFFVAVIRLTKRFFTLVDPNDQEKINEKKWSASESIKGGQVYAARYTNVNGNRRKIYMHRQIMNCPKGMEVDHINGNTLDNRKANLRIVTKAENIGGEWYRRRDLRGNNQSERAKIRQKRRNGQS